MQHNFYPMGRHLCQMVETFTLKTNGQFSITLSFFSGPAKKVYEFSVVSLVFKLLESVYQGKNHSKPNYQFYPTCPELSMSIQLHKPCVWLVNTVVCPHIYRQPPVLQPLPSVGFCWQHSDLLTKGIVPKFHEFLIFPPTSSLPCHSTRAATSFPWNISPWLYLINMSVLCSP